MDYKEKYQKALEWMKSVYPTMQGSDKEDAEHYFPELAESDDERITKDIVAAVEMYGDFTQSRKEEIYAYLEKQKEQKPRDYRKLYEETSQSEWFKENYEGKSLGEEQPTNSEIPNLSKPAELTPLTTLLSNYLKNDFEYFATRKWDEKKWNEILNIQASELLRYAKKELEKEQKPAEWSKEDEKIIESINMVFDMCAAKNIATEETTLYKLRAWLKSLRPTHWKPSKEQMNVLEAVEEYIVEISGYWGEYLHSLAEDLKEL